jgi:hypothetical protein
VRFLLKPFEGEAYHVYLGNDHISVLTEALLDGNISLQNYNLNCGVPKNLAEESKKIKLREVTF